MMSEDDDQYSEPKADDEDDDEYNEDGFDEIQDGVDVLEEEDKS